MVYLTRVEHFNAAHRLFNKNWSEEKNQEVFGKCANKNWHGHNYALEVTVKGNPDPETGYFINAKDLSKIIKEHATELLDHRNLDVDIDWLISDMPTSEIVLMSIWKKLEPEISKHCTLHKMKLVETPQIFVEYYGE